MMSHGHDVDNCSLRFCMIGIQLDAGESRSRTQIVQWNLLFASHPLWASVCVSGADSDDGNGDDGDDGNGNDGDDDGVGDGHHCTRSTLTSRLATSKLASKIPQT